MNATKSLTGTTIRTLQQLSSEAVLVERDGQWIPLPYLSDDDDIVVRSDARRWADELVDAAREQAEAEGTSTNLATLRKAAAAEGTAELLAERAREAVVATPTARRVTPVLAPLQRRLGRHAAPSSAVTQEQETHALCALLDELEEAGLLRAA